MAKKDAFPVNVVVRHEKTSARNNEVRTLKFDSSNNNKNTCRILTAGMKVKLTIQVLEIIIERTLSLDGRFCPYLGRSKC